MWSFTGHLQLQQLHTGLGSHAHVQICFVAPILARNCWASTVVYNDTEVSIPFRSNTAKLLLLCNFINYTWVYPQLLVNMTAIKRSGPKKKRKEKKQNNS